MRSAALRRDPVPALRIVPPARITADVIAELVAQNAAFIERIDLLALYIARLDDENVALRDRCDILAQYLEPLVSHRDRAADRELHAKHLAPPTLTRRRIS